MENEIAKETRHFISVQGAVPMVLRVYVKEADGSKKKIGAVWPYAEAFQESALQESVSSWELFQELSEILNDAHDRLAVYKER